MQILIDLLRLSLGNRRLAIAGSAAAVATTSSCHADRGRGGGWRSGGGCEIGAVLLCERGRIKNSNSALAVVLFRGSIKSGELFAFTIISIRKQRLKNDATTIAVQTIERDWLEIYREEERENKRREREREREYRKRERCVLRVEWWLDCEGVWEGGEMFVEKNK